MSDKIGNVKQIFMTADPIGQRRELIERINDDSDFSLEKRTDMTLATNTSKLMHFPLTGTRDFESKGAGTYRSLRSEFFSVMISQMILLDLMYNYVDQGDSGLTLKDGYGPMSVKDLGTVTTKQPFPENPYTGSIARCEHEAYTILKKMTVNGQFKVQVIKNQQRGLPVLNVFAWYDKLFFKVDAVKIGRYRNVYLNMTFTSQEHLANTYSAILSAKGEYEEARGFFHAPWEDLQQLCDALENSDLKPQFRDFVRMQRRSWQTQGKGFTTMEEKKVITDDDVQAFFFELLDLYEEKLADGKIPAPVRRLPRAHALHANAHGSPSRPTMTADELRLADEWGVDPDEMHSYLSMTGTRSHGQTADPNQQGDPRTPSINIDPRRPPPARRPQQETKSEKPRRQDSEDSPKQGEPSPSNNKQKRFPTDEKCRDIDMAKAKQLGLSQELACRRRILDKMGNATTCLGDHLTNHCPRAPKVKLAMLKPMHPYQTDSPIHSLDEWNQLFPGVSPFVEGSLLILRHQD